MAVRDAAKTKFPKKYGRIQAQTPDVQLQYSVRLMFSLRILFCSVVRFSPRRSVAPLLPEILPDAAFKASIMIWRSASSKVDAPEETPCTTLFFSWFRGTFRSSYCVRI